MDKNGTLRDGTGRGDKRRAGQMKDISLEHPYRI
jgi:hypothetical protein